MKPLGTDNTVVIPAPNVPQGRVRNVFEDFRHKGFSSNPTKRFADVSDGWLHKLAEASIGVRSISRLCGVTSTTHFRVSSFFNDSSVT
jgi:hypothetical protein